MRNIIGIIGGAGVAATNKLNDMIETLYTQNGAYRDCQHPEIIIYQATKAPSRSLYLEGRGDSFIPDYIEIANKLKQAGATHLCMNCNTAHYAINEIENVVGLPFINLIQETIIECGKISSSPKIGLMASEGCRLGKVYEKYINSFLPQSELISVPPHIQKEITQGICNIKNKARFLPMDNRERPRQIFTNICEYFYKEGATLIISGCTDIAVDFLPENYIKVPIIDSLTVLANTIYSFTQNIER